MLKNQDGVYEKLNMQNVNDAIMGNSIEWHAMYSKGRTEVMGFIVPRVTYPGVVMGACERGCGVKKCIKSGQRDKLTGMRTQKISIISTNQKLNKERIKREDFE